MVEDDELGNAGEDGQKPEEEDGRHADLVPGGHLEGPDAGDGQGEDHDVGEDVGPGLGKVHHVGVDARRDLSARVLPVQPDRVALEQVGEEEGDGPDADDADHGPHRRVEGIASKDSLVEEQDGELRETECQSGAQLLGEIGFQKDHVPMGPDSIAFVIQLHVFREVSVGSSHIDANRRDDGEYLDSSQSLHTD